MDHKVKTIRCDNGTEFKNMIMSEFYEMKGIGREFSIAKTPQQNGVAERKIRTLIEAARTMLVDSKLPTTFWAEAVNTACYVQNMVLVIKPHNKTPYELFLGPKSSEDKVADDARKKSTEVLRKENGVQDPAKEGDKNNQEKDLRDQEEALRKEFKQESKRLFDPGRERAQMNEFESMFRQDKDVNGNMMYTLVSVVGSSYVNLGGSIPVNAATLPNADLPTDRFMPDLEDTADTEIFNGAYDDEVKGAEADFNNLELTTFVNPILTTRIHKDHPKEQIIVDPLSAPQTRRMTKISQEHAMMDVKSAFLYGTIEEEVYVCQPPGFEDPHFPNKRYMHDPLTRRLYDTCGVHQVSTEKEMDIFILVEKEYPLSKAILTLIVISSPNHPTSDIEDVFSSNSPNYTLASPDYSPTSPGNTPFKSLNNSYGLVPIASPTLSLFQDDPYMKVMHAYDAIIPPQVSIPLPIIMPPSPMLSPMFNPQEFFVLEELLPPKEQIFKIGKSSIKIHLKHHEKQIEDILNYLKELSFHRIEKMEERLVNGWMIIQRDFDELKTKLEKVHSHISELQKKHIGQKIRLLLLALGFLL
nr:putative ribonuclease H-like domain-containing protein [Tanacetum cinerariifolium]